MTRESSEIIAFILQNKTLHSLSNDHYKRGILVSIYSTGAAHSEALNVSNVNHGARYPLKAILLNSRRDSNDMISLLIRERLFRKIKIFWYGR